MTTSIQDNSNNLYDVSLAIVGMSGRFPGAKDIDQFWQNLVNGIRATRFFSDAELLAAGVSPDSLKDPCYVKAGMVLDNIDLFDAPFFGFTPREADVLDPQVRLFLECAWEALENAGYSPEIQGNIVGIFAGKGFPGYMWHNLASHPELAEMLGLLQLTVMNVNDSLAPIVAYKLNLQGPSMSVQTNCSTSLVTVHLACQSLLAYECDMALAGGAAIELPHRVGYLYQEGSIVSPDGKCCAFDAEAKGTIFGSGVGVVVLKRLKDALEDGDHIYAVIRGSATNNDGMMRAGFTAPGLNGQAAVIAAALGNADVDPETISYVEAHGTGTQLGDSIELAAMISVFRESTDQTGYCAIGSAKPNVGHLDRAAGVTSLIKTALALHHKVIPPSLDFKASNPEIDLENSPFYVNTKLTEWESNGPWLRRAGVSSFGFGGTNAHVVLEEAPELQPSSASRPYQLLLLSAKTESALEAAATNLAVHLRDNPALNLADVAYTLQIGRAAFNYRRVAVCSSLKDAVDALTTGDPGRVFTAQRVHQQRSAAFVFPGVGDHYPDMARHLYQTEPVFKQWIDRCCALLKPHLGADLLEILYPPAGRAATEQEQDANLLRKMLGRQRDGAIDGPLQQTAFAQPAVFVVEYALAQLLMTWGIQPKALIGYSLGEYTAACVAGVLSLEDALALVAQRAQMIQELEEGAMLTVSLPEAEIAPFLDDEVALSGVLTPNVCVLAGPLAAIAALESRLTDAGVTYRRLPTSHAFHTPMLTPMVEKFTAAVKEVRLNPPAIPYLSNLSGDWITEVEATDADYWARHLCQTVRLSSGIATLLAKEDLVLLEVGPGQALSSLIKQHPACGRERTHLVLPTLPSSYERQEAGASLLNTLGKLWLAGVQIDWASFYRDERRHRVSLPTYPFERLRHWIEPREMPSYDLSGQVTTASPTEQVPVKKPDVADWFYRPVWEKTALPGLPATGDMPSPWLIFCDKLGLGEQIADSIARRGELVVRATQGEQFARLDEAMPCFTIRPGHKDDYQALCRELVAAKMVPQKIAHLWSVTQGDEAGAGDTHFAAAQDLGFYSLIHLMQALEEQGIDDQIETVVVTSNAQSVTGSEVLYPEKATVFGACLAITQECLNVKCRTLDLDVPPTGSWTSEIVESLIAELLTPSTDLQAAYRDGARFRRTYEAMRLEEQTTSPLRQGGTYLITGGLGGIGPVLAEHLARTVQANLVLIGRSALPARDEWEEWLATHDQSDRTVRRIRAVQALEDLGSQVLVFQADVADHLRMQEVVKATVTQFGRIDGVIHAAGISDREAFDSMLSIKPEQCELHFQPKVYGLYALETALEGQDLDFFLIFSSLSAVLGGLGFVGYTAANICMDAIARKHNRTAAVKWTSVNWDTWRVRQSQDEVMGDTIAVYEMTPQEGIAALEHVLANRAEIDTRVVHSTGDLDARIRQWIMLESLQAGTTARATAATSRPDLPTAYVPVNTEYERKIAAVWQGLLGIDQIGLYDNFFDLGGNSLIGLQVIARLKKEFGTHIPAVALFEAPTISALARYLQPHAGEESAADALAQTLAERRKLARQKAAPQAIAVVGMAGRFPGAGNVAEFWNNLCNGVESVTTFTDEELLAAGISPLQLGNPNYVKARPILDEADLFDAAFFGYSPRDAELTDPQHRLFLECAWVALETAGYNPRTFPGLIGVFGGTMASSYLLRLFANPPLLRSLAGDGTNYQLVVGNEVDSLTTTVSYKLNLKGPSFSVQTFCSTSLVATHLACQSLLNGECDMALAGGVSVRVPIKQGYVFVEGGMESPDGHCRTFDTRAKGTMFGDGVGIVVLKRLDDALADGDLIHAVIRGSAMNNDGSLKVGYSAPSVEAQAEVVAAALENAGLSADAIGYVEAHGTATELGDPIEVTALSRAFRQTTDRTGFCAIGTLKTNVGHLDRAAGVTGLIKTILTVKHGLIPPSLHFETPNPEIDFESSPFHVNTQLTEWKSNGQPRRAGVNSLGMGGTNVHAIVEEPPQSAPSGPSRPCQLLLWSARSEPALDVMTANLAQYLRENPSANLADVAFTLHVGRQTFEHRRMLVCRDVTDALAALEPLDPRRALTHSQPAVNRSIALMFPGVGDHYLQMGRELYESEALFRDTVEQCCSILFPYLGVKLRDLLYPANEPPTQQADAQGVNLQAMLRRDNQTTSSAAQRLNRTEVAQPIVFVIEYALARLLMAWGVRPSAMAGHSLGEYVAACLAGVLSLEDALKLVAERARLIQTLPAGSMLAVFLSLEAVQPLLSDEISLALHNGQETCVLAGSPEAIARLETELTAQEIACRRLDTTHAFHSHMMTPLAEPLTELVKTITLNPPRIPYLSNVTGDWITDEQATDPAYWAQHMCQPVRFFDALNVLLEEKGRILLEVGPGQALGSFAKQHPNCAREQISLILPTVRYEYDHQSDLAFLLAALGKLWMLGCEPNWTSFYKDETRRRLLLPTYPFQRQRYWLDLVGGAPGQATRGATQVDAASLERQPLDNWFYLPVWSQTSPHLPLPLKSSPEETSCWLLLVDECGLGAHVAERLAAYKQRVVVVQPGDSFAQTGEGHQYTIRPHSREDYVNLLRALQQQEWKPAKIVHLWSVTPDKSISSGQDFLEHALNLGFYSLMYLVQALGDLDMATCELSVITSHVQSVTGDETICPEKTTIIGPCKTIPQEYPDIVCRSIDITLPVPGSWQREALVANLLGELTASVGDVVVALRDRRRWIQAFEPLPLPPVDGEKSPLLRQNGVYLVTGGLGGIGMAIAEYLARTVQARLILTGRSGLPPREEWERIVAEENSAGRKIRGVQQLENLGAEVLTITADVADEEQMRAAVKQTLTRFGSIHGVIHAAGVPGEGLIQVKTADAIAKVLAPKVMGTLVLERVLEDVELDFLVLFSSETAFTGGGLGQIDYCAANAFLDGYAQRHVGNKRLVTSINWGEWQWNAWEQGLTGFVPEAQAYFKANRLKYGIAFEEGSEALGRILAHHLPWVAVSTRDLRPIVEGSNKQSMMRLLMEATQQLQESRPKYPRPTLGTSYAAPRNDLERKIAAIWSDLLGIDEIGIDDNFFELGGNSLVGINMVARLKKSLNIEKVAARVVYEAPTVSVLAKLLSQDQDERKAMLAARLERGKMRYEHRIRQQEPD
jgi:acyl transferase domain-containing protein/acyl carrier protein